MSQSTYPGAYHTNFAPLPFTGTSMSIPVVAPAGAPPSTPPPSSRPTASEANIMNENLRGQVRVLEDEVRLLRQAATEPLALGHTPSTGTAATPSSSDYYYASAAAIAARRRAQLAALRERTEQLHKARLSPSSSPQLGATAITRSRSAPNASRPLGRFVAPVEVVMVPTSSRHPSPTETSEFDGVRGARMDAEPSSGRGGKPALAFGRRVIPSARGAPGTARPSSATRRAPLSGRGSAGPGIPLQGDGRGASILPAPLASLAPSFAVPREDEEATRPVVTATTPTTTTTTNTIPLTDPLAREEPYYAFFAPHSGRPSMPLVDARDVRHPYQSPPHARAATVVVPPLAGPPASEGLAASTAEQLREDLALLTRTVDVLRRTLADRDDFLHRLAEELTGAEASAPSTGAATVCALTDELQHVRASLLSAQQQLLLKEQQFAQSQLALTRRTEDLATLLATPRPVPPSTTTTAATPAPSGDAPALPVTPGAPSVLPSLAALHTSTRTLDSNMEKPGATTASHPLAMDSLSLANPHGLPHTAWSSATVTPQLVPLSLPTLLVPDVPLSSAQGMAQTLPPPPAQSNDVLPPPSTPPPPPPPPPPLVVPTTTDALAALQVKLDAANRKLQAWESWFQTQQSQPQPQPQTQSQSPHVQPSASAAVAAMTDRTCAPTMATPGLELPPYYSAYTITSRDEAAATTTAISERPRASDLSNCARCTTLGSAAAPVRTMHASLSSGAFGVLSQSNWELREDVREAVVRERVLRDLATRERELAEERLARAVKNREDAESGSATPPPPPKSEVVD